MNRTFLRTSIVAALTTLILAPSAVAAPDNGAANSTSFVLFAENRGIARIDNNAAGPDHGDLVHRELALSRTLTGPVIGVSYSQSEIVAYNPEAKVDMRRFSGQLQLPGGQLFASGLTRLPIGSVPQPGWKDTYAIVGGTGIYAGARGVEKLTLLEDGKTFRLVITLTK